MDDIDLDHINAERAQCGLPPLSREQAEEARRTAPEGTDITPFLIATTLFTLAASEADAAPATAEVTTTEAPAAEVPAAVIAGGGDLGGAGATASYSDTSVASVDSASVPSVDAASTP